MTGGPPSFPARCRAMKKPQEGAVEMMRRIRDAHFERFRDRPVEERLVYYRERA